MSPTIESTFFKIIEESGELARNVLAFLPFEELEVDQVHNDPQAVEILGEVCTELLDVAQTCVSMIFVLEQTYGICMDQMISLHLEKLQAKGYQYNREEKYFITSESDYKYLHLPRLDLTGVTLLTTACKLQEEIGEAGQFWGKGQGKSGEQAALDSDSIIKGYSLELLDIAQCCFTMMYILQEKYRIDFGLLVRKHLEKLRLKGYCK
ncbi:MAG: nucleotide pyrophosphohydrolase [Bacillota bacterium]|nr:nucleotide pyrophosphohydrolase [Bacillota bacterium]